MKKFRKLNIIPFGAPELRKKAVTVNIFNSRLSSTIDSMARTLYLSKDGAAIAAPQVSILKKIIVIDYMEEYLELVNPYIIAEKGEQTDYEGCLSLPGYFGLVPRFESIVVQYMDRFGKDRIIKAEGKMARCIQHEIDHLSGILFVDRMNDDFLTNFDTKEKISRNSILELANGSEAVLHNINIL